MTAMLVVTLAQRLCQAMIEWKLTAWIMIIKTIKTYLTKLQMLKTYQRIGRAPQDILNLLLKPYWATLPALKSS